MSVSRLGQALSARGLQVGLWAPDGSAVSSTLVNSKGGLHRLSCRLTALLDSFGRPDIIHDNGIWLPHHHAIARLAARHGITRIVSPRGMLEPWAIRFRAIKKQLAWRLYQRSDLKAADLIHATSSAEGKNLTALGLEKSVQVVPNGMDLARPASQRSTEAGKEQRHTALYVGRVHPKKGLANLVQAWAAIRPRDWKLIVAGPDELGHVREIRTLIQYLKLAEEIKLLGPVYGAEKFRLLNSADLFVLPSFSENFGMAVAEALAHGLPVVTTTGTPWQELELNRCGWWVSPDCCSIAAALSHAFGLPVSELQAMGQRGRKLIHDRYSWELIAHRMAAIYEGLQESRARGAA